ncbi:hypothetical protein [Ornithinibacillus contaminans]|nr:hypothetical protein [Ornithinibacillus contaminans]
MGKAKGFILFMSLMAVVFISLGFYFDHQQDTNKKHFIKEMNEIQTEYEK